MKVEYLNKEEKLDVIITTLMVEVIEKIEKEYRIKVKRKNSIKTNLKDKINNSVNLERIRDFYIEKSELALMPGGSDYHQEVKIEMLLPEITDQVDFKFSLFYEPNAELVSEIYFNYQLSNV